MERLLLEHPDEVALAQRAVQWARANSIVLRFSSTPTGDSMVAYIKLGVQDQKLFSIQTNGVFTVLFRQLSNKLPVADAATRQAFLAKLTANLPKLPPTDFDPAKPTDKTAWPLAALATSDHFEELLRMLHWMASGLRSEFEALLARGRSRKANGSHDGDTRHNRALAANHATQIRRRMIPGLP